ncbi:MAG TPA: DUF3307 domain-containing protein [Elusimicrobiota bacterium]|nr:DUF3307 domain-containing protein [Elusimicrobiota bacterium]
MAIFWRLVLAHFIADFTLQTNHIASWKRESRLGMIVHVVTHPVVSMALTWRYLTWPWIQTRWFHCDGWACILIICFFHWLEDEWRVWSIVRTGSPDSTGFFLWDQVVHLAIILAMAPTLPSAPVEPWVIPVLCAVVLAHAVSVLIYFLENDLWGESQVLGGQKYRYILERFFGAGLFLLPGSWFLFAFAWLGWLVYQRYRKTTDRTWLHVAIGTISVMLLGLVVRGLIF